MSFYRDNVYPHLVSALGDPPPIREIRQRIVPLAVGFKYNPTSGGPADTDVTDWVEGRANELLRADNAGVKRVPFRKAIQAPSTHQEDLMLPYVRDLKNVVDMGCSSCCQAQ